MTDTMYDAWEAAVEHNDAHNLPVSLKDAVLAHRHYATDVDVRDLATIAPIAAGRVNPDEEMTVTRIGEHGAVLHDDRGGVAMSVGHVSDVLERVTRETEYVVSSIEDTEYVPPSVGDEA